MSKKKTTTRNKIIKPLSQYHYFEEIVAQMKELAVNRLQEKQFGCFVILLDTLLADTNQTEQGEQEVEPLLKQLNLIEDYLDVIAHDSNACHSASN